MHGRLEMPQSAVLILATAMHACHGDAALAFVDYQIDMSTGDNPGR